MALDMPTRNRILDRKGRAIHPALFWYDTRRGKRYGAIAMHDGKQRWQQGFTTIDEAEGWRMETVVSMRRGQAGKAPARMTLAEYIAARWWPDVGPDLAASSAKAYASHRKHIERYIGAVKLRILNAQDVQDFKNAMQRDHVGQSMRAATFKRLRQMLNHAVALGLLTVNPCNTITAPQEPEHKAPSLSVGQVQHLLRIAEEDTAHGALFTVVVLTGLRWGELRRMRWADLDFTTGKLDLSGGKTEESDKPMWLGPQTMARLQTHRLAQMKYATEMGGTPPPHVFTDAAGQQLDYFQFTRNVWYPLRKKLELPKMHFHDLRHVQANLLARAHVHPSVAQRRLRHADVRTTIDYYTDVADDQQRDAASAVEELLR